MVAAVAVALSACSGRRGESSAADTVWQGRDSYVRIERQDVPRGQAVAPNSHPVDLAPGQIRNAFGAVYVRLPGDEEPSPVFNEAELEILGEQISKALARADPNRDVTFTILGRHAGPLRLPAPKVTTGRVFYRGGQLNLIFGAVQDDARIEDGILRLEDPRLRPYVPGTRASTTRHAWVLTVPPGRSGVYRVAGMNRDDWLVFTAEAMAQAPSALPERAPRGVAPPAGRSIQERLATLEDLRRRGLITEQEYRIKRQEILNAL